MNKKQEIQEALTTAMKAKDEDTKRTLRLVMSSIKLAEVEEGSEIDDSRILGILQKEVKTRQDAFVEAKKANREDLVSAAKKEIMILNLFLPKKMDKNALEQLAKEVIDQTGASSMDDMGQVMKHLMPKLAGRATGQEASTIVREMLQKN